MSTDRELLELAAKAAGIKIKRSRLEDRMHRDMLIQGGFRNDHGDLSPWNPLTDDGDALRLAVKLKLLVNIDGTGFSSACDGTKENDQFEMHGGDHYAATRRVIVRAAAEIGKTIQ